MGNVVCSHTFIEYSVERWITFTYITDSKNVKRSLCTISYNEYFRLLTVFVKTLI